MTISNMQINNHCSIHHIVQHCCACIVYQISTNSASVVRDVQTSFNLLPKSLPWIQVSVAGNENHFLLAISSNGEMCVCSPEVMPCLFQHLSFRLGRSVLPCTVSRYTATHQHRYRGRPDETLVSVAESRNAD